MSLSVELESLMAYSDHERAKWRRWVAADPARLTSPFQPGKRFPTVWSLLDHVFFVERRHLTRLQGGTLPESTGLAEGDWEGLFAYAAAARADLRRYVGGLNSSQAAETLTFTIPLGTFTMSRHKLATHILLHEIRHLAQLAYAARVSGQEPPGEHDYFYAPV